MIDLVNMLLRIATFIPLVVVVTILAYEWWKNIDMNGLTNVRRSLLLLSIGIGAEIALRLIGDFHALLTDNSVQDWLRSVQWLVVASRVVLFWGVIEYTRLVIGHRKQ